MGTRVLLLSFLIPTAVAAATVGVQGGDQFLPGMKWWGKDPSSISHLSPSWPDIDSPDVSAQPLFPFSSWFQSPPLLDVHRALSPPPDSSSGALTLTGLDIDTSAYSDWSVNELTATGGPPAPLPFHAHHKSYTLHPQPKP